MPSPRPSEPAINPSRTRRIAWPTPKRVLDLRSPHVVAERDEVLLVLPEARLEVHLPAGTDAPARRVERRLRVVAVVDEPHDHLDVPLRLHRASHHAERAEKRTALEEHPRDDRVEGPAPGGEPVRVALVLDERRGAVLEDDARPRRDHARPERLVDALDERDRGAVRIDRAQVRRASPRQDGRSRVERSGLVDERAPYGEVGRVEQLPRAAGRRRRARRHPRARASSPRSVSGHRAPGRRRGRGR